MLLAAPVAEAKAKTSYYHIPSTNYSYSSQYGSMDQDELVEYLIQLIYQMQAQLADRGSYGPPYGNAYGYYGKKYSYYVGNPRSGSSSDNEPKADTESATSIGDNDAYLRGEVDMNDFNNGRVFFVYGEDEDQIEDVEDDFDSYSDVDEDGDDLQKVLVDNDLDGDENYSKRVSGLDEDTDYYFTICVEYEDEDDDDTLECGDVEDFTTDDDGSSSNDDEPEATTYAATSIDDDSAKLRGYIDMNDFDNGIVFFVYGEDESQIDDVEDDYDSYNDVDEDGDDLQKHKIDSDLDGSSSYTLTVNGLDDNTDYYFQICVEYEDEDDDDTLVCGSTRHFETD